MKKSNHVAQLRHWSRGLKSPAHVYNIVLLCNFIQVTVKQRSMFSIFFKKEYQLLYKVLSFKTARSTSNNFGVKNGSFDIILLMPLSPFLAKKIVIGLRWCAKLYQVLVVGNFLIGLYCLLYRYWSCISSLVLQA